LDIRAATAYYENIAPDPAAAPRNMGKAVQDRSFLIWVGAVKAL
jgi:hypothetical protein